MQRTSLSHQVEERGMHPCKRQPGGQQLHVVGNAGGPEQPHYLHLGKPRHPPQLLDGFCNSLRTMRANFAASYGQNWQHNTITVHTDLLPSRHFSTTRVSTVGYSSLITSLFELGMAHSTLTSVTYLRLFPSCHAQGGYRDLHR